MRSPVYWHPAFYRLAMKLLYGRYFQARYAAIAGLIPAGATVVEVCAGDVYLYDHYLRKKNVTYTGLDVNSAFVSGARRRKISFSSFDILRETIPAADYVIMQASLYRFIPTEQEILKKLLNAVNNFLIVAEPVRNLSDSPNPVLRWIARHSANPGKEYTSIRFNKISLRACFEKHPEFKEMKEMDGGREMIGIFKK